MGMYISKLKQFVRWLVKAVLQICFLIVFFLIGEQLQQWFNLVVPGSLIGLILLFTCLSFKIIKMEWINVGAAFLLMIMPLFFIPSMTGLMDYGQLFLHQGIFIIIDIVVSAFVIFFVSGWAVQQLIKVWPSSKKADKEVTK